MDRKKPGENPWQNARIKTPRDDDDRPQRPRRPSREEGGGSYESTRPAHKDAGTPPARAPRADAGKPYEPTRPTRADERKAHQPAAPQRGSTAPARHDAAAFDERVERPQRRNSDEVRVYGRNACLAAFAHRPDDLRKVYLIETRIADFKAVLAWCVKHRLGYRVVEADDLDRLTDTQHHEGVCFELRRQATLGLAELLRACPTEKPALLVWLDGVGNPHNVGAILRSAANFGVAGMILPAHASELPGAALRVAEGAAESVRLARAHAGEDIAAALRTAGFRIAATVPRDGVPLYKNPLPPRLALVLGAEGEGMSKALIAAADLKITVPGTGAVESLNVSASAAVFFAEFWRLHA